jgi:hypothetical protein
VFLSESLTVFLHLSLFLVSLFSLSLCL